MPGTFKILLGIEQIWLMVELIDQTHIAKLILTASIVEPRNFDDDDDESVDVHMVS